MLADSATLPFNKPLYPETGQCLCKWFSALPHLAMDFPHFLYISFSSFFSRVLTRYHVHMWNWIIDEKRINERNKCFHPMNGEHQKRQQEKTESWCALRWRRHHRCFYNKSIQIQRSFEYQNRKANQTAWNIPYTQSSLSASTFLLPSGNAFWSPVRMESVH